MTAGTRLSMMSMVLMLPKVLRNRSTAGAQAPLGWAMQAATPSRLKLTCIGCPVVNRAIPRHPISRRATAVSARC
jgi:hypothetical protein